MKATRVLLASFALTVGYAVFVLLGLPPRSEIRALARVNPGKTGVMRQREEEARRAKRATQHTQVLVPLSRISRHLINAVVASEDPKFFGHEGIDWEAVRESAEADVRKGGFVRGGSTITQQLAKNLFFTTKKSLTRKLREMIVARWLEEDLTKARILEVYLNVIEWGDGVYGCEAAARRYYSKSAADLDPAEAAGLAAMVPSPRRINPRVSPALHARAQRRVLWLMEHAGYVRRGVSGLGVEPPSEVTEPETSEAEDEAGQEPIEPDLDVGPSASPAAIPETPAPETASPSPEPTPPDSE